MSKDEQRVLVFKDIKNKRWTIWNESKTKHLGYRQNLTLKDCIFFVDVKSQKKISKTKKRFPHAWVYGIISKKTLLSKKKSVTYNPFTDKTFMCKGKPLTQSKLVRFDSMGKVFIS